MKIELSSDQTRLFTIIQKHPEKIGAFLPGMDAPEIMKCLVNLGIGFCVWLETPVDQRPEKEKLLRADRQIEGIIKLIAWVRQRGQKNGP